MLWLAVLTGCTQPIERAESPPPEALASHCDANIGAPRIEQLDERTWVALGYDLANTVLIRTDVGNVVVDVGMSPARARPVRDALLEVSPGPIAAVIYTHSHIDHMGGARVWVEQGTRIYATEALEGHFYEQYGTLLPSERRRASRQFGHDVPDAALPCSAIGRRTDLDAALELGAVLPTDTFTGSLALEIGGVEIELVEAHGETHDQLFVWLPQSKMLLPGDNWYRAFPNLYTVRGTRPRPVEQWIDSLDRMRALEPSLLVPSHTTPVHGARAVQRELTVYRDGIAWVHDAVIRGANQGQTVEQLAASIELPAHLGSSSSLMPLYGEVGWSVRAIYGNRVGWFDGRVDHLYPLPPRDLARRAIDGMGGPEAVLEVAGQAEDPRWALTLAGWLRDDGRAAVEAVADLEQRAARTLARDTPNSNGRAYLLQSAAEAAGEARPLGQPRLSDAFVDGIPIAQILSALPVRLDPATAIGVHESVRIELVDEGPFQITVRNGVCEIRKGDPLPGTPPPVATVRGTASDFRRLALQRMPVSQAISAFDVEGSAVALAGFFSRFERGL